MEVDSMPVQKHTRRRRTLEQKLAMLQEWRDGLPQAEVCRKYGVSGAPLYKWRRDLERGLADRGELVPRSQVTGLQKRVDELEKALGRSSLENQILKKFYELKGLKLPEGA
ncbi:MAG: transposase [Candidatus Methylomirabilales bacterium]